MNWRIKGVTQKLLSSFPWGVRVNDVLQKTLGTLRNFDNHVRCRAMEDWIGQINLLHKVQSPLQNLRYLEIGTGWMPILPVCYYLSGADSCTTLDLTRHLKPSLSFKMLEVIDRLLPSLAEASHQNLTSMQQRLSSLRNSSNLDELLQRAHVNYYAPVDASASGLESESVDIVFSNNVLEHIQPAIILRLMRETYRLLRPGGLVVHSVDCYDHYSYFDHSITPINYLRFNENQWAFWNNDLQYQNRLRPQDFLKLAEQAGLKVILANFEPQTNLLAELPTLKIAPEFQQYSPEQLCCTSVDFVARKS